MKRETPEEKAARAARNQAIAEEYVARVDVRKIAKKYGMTPGSIYTLMKTLAVSRFANPNAAKPRPRIDEERIARFNAEFEERKSSVQRRLDRQRDICNMYLSGIGLGDVGEKFGITRERVRQILNRNGVKERHGGINSERRIVAREKKAEARKAIEETKAQRQAIDAHVRDLYDSGKTFREMVEITGTGHGAILQRLRRTGGMNRNRSAGKPRKIITDEKKLELAQRYAKFEDVKDLAEEFGVSHNSISVIAGKLGYKRGSGPGIMEWFKSKSLGDHNGE